MSGLNITASNEDVIDAETGEIIKEAGVMPAPAKAPRAFTAFLNSIENGKTHDDLSKMLQDLVGDLAQHQNDFGARTVSGDMTLKLAFKLEDGIMRVVPELKKNTPKKPRGHSVFWVTPENNLVDENPRQRSLFEKR